MHPIITKIFGIPIYSYGIFLALAFFVCIILILRRAVSIGIAPQYILDLSLYIIIAGIAGARLLYIAFNLNYYIAHPAEIFLINKGGLIFYGGFILALITGFTFAKIKKLPLLKLLDIFILYLPIGQAIGRIGCFLNGCCYGRSVHSVFGVHFPEQSFAAMEFGPGNWVYPVQIYSGLINLLIFLILVFRIKHKRFDGQILLDYMFLYGSARFSLEFLRADNPMVLYGFNMPQLVSLLMIIVSLVIWILKACRKPASTVSQ